MSPTSDPAPPAYSQTAQQTATTADFQVGNNLQAWRDRVGLIEEGSRDGVKKWLFRGD